MELKVQEVECVHRDTIPNEGETIADDFEIEKMIPYIKEMLVYERPKAACPFNRGNWVIDLTMFNDQVFSIKLPISMKQDHIENFIKPLVILLEEFKKSKMN